ncbi:MAG: ATP-binding protein [Opitutaceae bacterium]|nr:ATP-binding protein [Opitutaceae bacterium]
MSSRPPVPSSGHNVAQPDMHGDTHAGIGIGPAELERKLQRLERMTREIARLSKIGAWEIDLATGIPTWWEGTRSLLGQDEAQPLPAGTAWPFFAPDAQAAIEAAIAALTPGASVFELEVEVKNPPAAALWLRVMGSGTFEGGRCIALGGTIQDITAHRRREEMRRRIEAQLFQAQKMETLRTLAGGIAHDFNNILTGIIGYQELAAEVLNETDPARVFLTEASRAGLRARELVGQILSFGRRRTSDDHAPIDLRDVIAESQRLLRASLPAHISIETCCEPGSGTIRGDMTQMQQVLHNLGSNAGDAMREMGGVLRITLARAEGTFESTLGLGRAAPGGYVRLTVSDTGRGMDEAARSRIFDPFFSTKPAGDGTGLGLAVVHGIVRAHHGAIEVESAPGAGSMFHIYLPAGPEDRSALLAAPDEAPRGKGEYVCIVEADEVVNRCTQLVLEGKGYRTRSFASADQCLAAIGQDPTCCTVLVTDQTRPGGSGSELATQLRRQRSDLPVVIMSGYFTKLPPEALGALGRFELLTKPFTSDELLQAVHRALHPAGPS